MSEKFARGGFGLGGGAYLFPELHKRIHIWPCHCFLGTACCAAFAKADLVVVFDGSKDSKHLGDINGNLLNEKIFWFFLGCDVFVAVLHQFDQCLNGFICLEVIEEVVVHLVLRFQKGFLERPVRQSPTLAFRHEVVPKNRLGCAEEVFKVLFLGFGIVDGLVAVVHGFIPGLHKEHESKLSGRMLLQGLANGNKVLKTFGHLEPLDVQMSRVQKIVDPLTALVESFCLRHFIVMVRKHEVDSTSVNVKILTNNVTRHDGALNVPSGPARPPRRFPGWFSRFACLPECKVIGVFLLRGTSSQSAFALCHFLRTGVNARFEFAIVVVLVLEGVRVEVDAAVGVVAIAVFDDALDVIHDLRHVFGDACDNVGLPHSETGHVFEKLQFKFPRVVLINFLIRHGCSLFLVELCGKSIATGSNDGFDGVSRLLYSSLGLSELIGFELCLGQRFGPLFSLFAWSALWQRLFQIRNLALELLPHAFHRHCHVILHRRVILLLQCILSVLFQQLVLSRPQNYLIVHVRDVHLIQQVIVKVVLHHSSKNIKG
mmetsp:Transcript_6058/g.8720  ORF Transcript_6058/g.8720 Transcript_6058/m.8720 type:complete len:543 (+) Transcript_6058:728-2356(+)